MIAALLVKQDFVLMTASNNRAYGALSSERLNQCLPPNPRHSLWYVARRRA
jgi:hypothetical protein